MYEDEMALIDAALAGQSEQIKARVLHIIIKHKIAPDNEFFILFAALGQLQVFLEDTPKLWLDVFSQFEGYLREWTDTNLVTLGKLSKQSESIQDLSQTLKELSSSTERSNSLTQQLEQTCEQLEQVYSVSMSSLQSENSQLHQSLAEMSDILQVLSDRQVAHAKISAAAQNSILAWQPTKEAKIWNLAFKALPAVAGAVSVLFIMIFVQQGLILSELNRQGTRVDWLLQKANRRDCLDGLKAADSPECLSSVKP